MNWKLGLHTCGLFWAVQNLLGPQIYRNTSEPRVYMTNPHGPFVIMLETRMVAACMKAIAGIRFFRMIMIVIGIVIVIAIILALI